MTVLPYPKPRHPYQSVSGMIAPDERYAASQCQFFGAAAELYVQMQARHDLWLAEQRLRDSLAAIEPAKS